MGIQLRPWRRADGGALFQAARTSPELRVQFGGIHLSGVGAAEVFIVESLRFDDGTKNWAIVEDGVAVGNLGAAAIERRHDTAWMSYWLAASSRGKGYAVAGLVAASEWLFADGMHRLELGHRLNNPASCRVATAAGYRAEGVEREKLRYGDERFDVETHARLATDDVPSRVQRVAVTVGD